jgi:hypothetical protein
MFLISPVFLKIEQQKETLELLSLPGIIRD